MQLGERMTRPNKPLVRRRFSSLAKPSGAACNLDCTYCFFLSKEMLYTEQNMSEETLDVYMQNFLRSQPDGEVVVEWQGGEPTLRGLGFFEEAVALGKRYGRPGQRVRHSLQTNGTLLTEQWVEFLARERFLVGLSMEGPKDAHDLYRVNKAGRGSHGQVLRAWHRLQAAGVDTNILCTVHHGNEGRGLEVYQYFRDTLGAKFIQFIPIVERQGSSVLPYYHQGGDVSERSITPGGWGQFLIDVFEEGKRRDVGSVSVQMFDAMVGNALGAYSMCIHAPTCGSSLAVMHTGEIYACDHWVEEGFERGNVTQIPLADVLKDPRQVKFGNDKRALLPDKCLSCNVRWACEGGCPKDRFLGDPRRPLNYLCEGYQRFYRHASEDTAALVGLLEEGRPAADLMNYYAQ